MMDFLRCPENGLCITVRIPVLYSYIYGSSIDILNYFDGLDGDDAIYSSIYLSVCTVLLLYYDRYSSLGKKKKKFFFSVSISFPLHLLSEGLGSTWSVLYGIVLVRVMVYRRFNPILF
ncbi:hypothetical protein HOY80DRAFT_716813 [Tuber brumale]|nr:hypothetical protein HOY80DRAFT_716813 [Tuber brumale]